MNTNSLVLRAAMVTVLGATIAIPGIAHAIVKISPGAPATLATELVKGTGESFAFDAGHTFEIDISAAAARNISDTTPMEIRLTLTNGATFNTAGLPAATNFKCNYSGAAASTPAAANVLGGTVGTTTVTYKLPPGDIAGTSPMCVIDGSLTVKLASGQKDYTIAVTGLLKSVGEPVNIVTAGTFVTFQQSYAVAVTTKSVTVDVAAPSLSQKFLGGATVANLGTITYAAKGTSTAPISKIAGGVLNDTVNAADLLTTVNIIVTGSPLVPGAGMKVGLEETTYNCNGLHKVTTPGETSATVSGVTFSELDVVPFAAGVDVCYTVDGGTRLEKGKISFEITPGTINGANLTVADNALATVYKNGTSVKVLNIPNDSATTDASFIRVYNFGNTPAKVYGTMYEWDKAGTAGAGKVVGTKNVELVSVDANAVKVIKVADLKSKFGVATWDGRAWMQVEGDSQQIRVQALIRSGGATGPLINFGDRVLEDGGALCRSGSTCQ